MTAYMKATPRHAPIIMTALCLAAPSIWAQAPTVVPEPLSCTSCQIVTVSTQQVRANAKGEGAVQLMANGIAEDSQKRLWILGGLPALLFNDRGEYVRSFGVQGRGPNEYQNPIAALRLPGDSMMMVDAGAPRITVLDRDLQAKRTITFPYNGANGALVLHWPDSVLVSAWIRTPPNMAHPLHLVSLKGSDAALLRSFGLADPKVPIRRLFDPTPLVVAGTDGTLLSIDPLEYQISVWSREGTLLRKLDRRPTWFAERSLYYIGSQTKPPPPRVAAISIDERGRCWVFTNVPSTHWQHAWAGVKPSAKEVAPSAIDFLELFDTQIEVIDLKNATVVARRRLPGSTAGVLSGMRVLLQSNSDQDEPQARVVTLAVRP